MMAQYVIGFDERAKACLDRVCDRMRKKGDSSPKPLFEILEYLESWVDALDAAEFALAETQKKLTRTESELSRLRNTQQADITAVFDAIKRCGWKPMSINFSESGVEIFLE